jgi:ribosome-interacting GTPase 1
VIIISEDMTIEEIIDLLADAMAEIKSACEKIDLIGCELTQNIKTKLRKGE